MKLNLEKRSLTLKQVLLTTGILSAILSVLQILMQIGHSGFASFLDAINPINIVINCSIFYAVIFLLICITGKLNISFAVVALFTQLLLIINHYKIYFLSVPLKASDFILGKEATDILGNYEITISIKVVLLTIFVIALVVFMFRSVKNEKIKLHVRLFGAALTVFCLIISYTYIYSDNAIYEHLLVAANEFSEVDVANGHGFMYSLINGVSKTRYLKPDGYNIEEVKAILDKEEEKEAPPNVIAVMSEAFFDIREAQNLEFNKNPLPTYTRLKQEGIYGDMIVPGFAGNTSSTEYEFLTGVNISLIDRGMPVPYKTFLNKKAYALPQYFKQFDFNTVAMHPGHNWFYNRVLAYNCMGFSRSVFLENLDYKTEMVNYYTTDKEAAKMIIDDYSEHLENNPEQGYFNFTVTIQNHGPYMNYDTEKEEIIKRLDGMDDIAYHTVDNYVQGLNDADNFLKEIEEYIESVDKPTVVVFFGDHLPFLDSELKYYDLIGYDITSESDWALYRKYKTPYLIFSNQAFKSSELKKGHRVLRGKRNTISSNYLACELFKYMNVKMPPYFEYVNEVKNEINIISPRYYMIDGSFETELNDELLGKINTLKNLQYYNMMEYDKKTE